MSHKKVVWSISYINFSSKFSGKMFEYDHLALDVAEQFAQIRSNAVANSAAQIFDPFVSLANLISVSFRIRFLEILLHNLLLSANFIGSSEIKSGRVRVVVKRGFLQSRFSTSCYLYLRVTLSSNFYQESLIFCFLQ